jgi:DNA gyrase subunit B
MDALREIGQKGAIVSRYKGLGEMNPDELWETTMDPTKRTLHRVRIEDCEMAEKIFSDLMADNVSARRALVEKMCAGDAQIDL